MLTPWRHKHRSSQEEVTLSPRKGYIHPQDSHLSCLHVCFPFRTASIRKSVSISEPKKTKRASQRGTRGTRGSSKRKSQKRKSKRAKAKRPPKSRAKQQGSGCVEKCEKLGCLANLMFCELLLFKKVSGLSLGGKRKKYFNGCSW